MFAWISSNYQVLNVLINTAMLGVWLVYLQIFLMNYLRKRRPKLLIGMGAGFDFDARCLISNMSDDAVYVADIVASLSDAKGKWKGDVTEVRNLPDEASARDPKQTTKQGPLRAGAYMDAGSFKSFVEQVLPKAERGAALSACDGCTLELTVLAVYAAEDLPIAARRRFSLTMANGDVRVRAGEIDTEQIRTRRQRKRLQERLKQDKPLTRQG